MHQPKECPLTGVPLLTDRCPSTSCAYNYNGACLESKSDTMVGDANAVASAKGVTSEEVLASARDIQVGVVLNSYLHYFTGEGVLSVDIIEATRVLTDEAKWDKYIQVRKPPIRVTQADLLTLYRTILRLQH